ncbi:beta-1,3-glucanase family protein [Catellatospora citrea]|uniref:Beta-1,3-glucanase n=1 Tax=Catellatospora citrea TaxID=53366 RepID=A0A8J3KF43_9ACTN|nr:beta-1,3-glucanase family protein [Catellatospora citrea]RKE12745.1 chitobiase/beta-hexosaminidase-like protein [Catellatospora citrea]GIF96015.1 hypothetical protein Cci01nite_11090 [Catellatospora citrea]
MQSTTRPSVRSRLLGVAALVAAMLSVTAPATPAHAAPDYTQGVTSVSPSQARIWFTPATPAALVDVHYLLPGQGQQNFRMTKNGATWEQAIGGLSTGTVVEYWFTYEKAGPLFDTPHFTYTHGGGTGGADYSQGVTSLNAGQARIWFTPTIPATLVDVHYLRTGQGQQDFRMTKAGSTWEQIVGGLTTGTVIEYWFTYEKAGPLLNTPHFTYTHGGGGETVVATPVFSPPGGTYAGAQTVAISTATVGASIRYTTDGSTPTASSSLYAGPVSVPASRTLKAIGLKSGLGTSAVATAVYTIGSGGGSGTFPVNFVNNTRGVWTDSQLYLTFLGQVTPGQWSYLRADGTVRPINHMEESAPGHLTKNGRDYANMSFTVAQGRSVTFPNHIEGGRIYISLGSPMYIPISADDRGWGGPDLLNPADPNADVYFDWYELAFAHGQFGFGGNTTQVDQFGFPMTARLQQASTGYDQTVGITQTRAQVYAGYQASVGAAFTGLAGPYRILAPRTAPAFKPGGARADHLQGVIDQVWNRYTNTDWTQDDHGQIYRGRVVNGVLTGTKNDGTTFSVPKPNTAQVFECSGALAVPPPANDTTRAVGRDFCAAFNRGVAANADTADWLDASKYYLSSPRNDYAAYFHSIGIDKRSYAFAYDDVNDQSSVKIIGNTNPPSLLTISIGW